MKKSILIFALVLLSFPDFLFSQCYTVLSVKGEIISEKTGQPIKEMDEICATDKLTFGSKDSKAAVLSSEQGRFVVKLSDKKNGNDLTAFVSSILNSGKERLSTKYIDMDELDKIKLNFYKEEFGSNYFIIKESRIYIDTAIYPMNNENYFYVKYLYDGKELEKKLKYDKDKLILNKEVFTDNGSTLDPVKVDSVSLYYSDGKRNEKQKLTTFKLSLLDEEKLKSELSNYITILRKTEKANYMIVEEVSFFINDVYGNVNYYDLATYLDLNFGIKF